MDCGNTLHIYAHKNIFLPKEYKLFLSASPEGSLLLPETAAVEAPNNSFSSSSSSSSNNPFSVLLVPNPLSFHTPSSSSFSGIKTPFSIIHTYHKVIAIYIHAGFTARVGITIAVVYIRI